MPVQMAKHCTTSCYSITMRNHYEARDGTTIKETGITIECRSGSLWILIFCSWRKAVSGGWVSNTRNKRPHAVFIVSKGSSKKFVANEWVWAPCDWRLSGRSSSFWEGERLHQLRRTAVHWNRARTQISNGFRDIKTSWNYPNGLFNGYRVKIYTCSDRNQKNTPETNSCNFAFTRVSHHHVHIYKRFTQFWALLFSTRMARFNCVHEVFSHHLLNLVCRCFLSSVRRVR